MTDRLSREAITEYRAEVARGDENRGFTGVMVSHHHLRTLLDAYEAQRKCPGTVDSCTSTAVLERIKVALDRPGVSQSYVDWARECRAAWEAQRPRPASEALALDTATGSEGDAERSRAIHRVVRAMHDGACPSCGYLAAAEQFIEQGAHLCPSCGFIVSEHESRVAMQQFLPLMGRSVAVFEEWRRGLPPTPERDDG